MTATGRVIDVLEAFSSRRPTLSLSDLARRTGTPLTTTHRLVGELAARGLLHRRADGQYEIGLRLFEIGALGTHHRTLREAALPFMEDLYEATHENVQLAVLDGTDAVYVERIAGRQSVHVISRAGGRLPLHATGVGLVLLAHADPAVQHAVLSKPLERFTRYTITDPRRLRTVLAAVRRDGVALSVRQIETVASSVAAPVRNAGTVAAAISVVASSRTDPGRYTPAVVATARGISRVLARG